MSEPFNKVLGILRDRGTVKRSGANWRCLCPAHNDETPSLDVAEGKDGRVLFQCRSHGCAAGEIAAALGLTVRDLFPDDPTAAKSSFEDRIVQTYRYRDEAGNVLFETVRLWAPLPKGKDFRQRHRKLDGGWDWNLNGTQRVPYRLPELLTADPARTVFVAEGEKDCDNLAWCGQVATTNPLGAGKWPSNFAKYFEGRNVVILPDNDEPGEKHAKQVQVALTGTAASVRIVRLPDLPPKGDFTDWMKVQLAGQGEQADLAAVEAELVRLCGAAVNEPTTSECPPAEPKSRWPQPKYASELSRAGTDIEWIWNGCVARGHITLFSALMKSGKSTLVSHLLRCIQFGMPFAGRETRKCRTLVVSEESETIWSIRRDDLGLDDSLSTILQPMLAKPTYGDWSEFVEYITDQAIERQCDLVVVDTLGKFAPWKNENDAADVQGTMNPLDRLTKAGLGVLAFHHFGKADGSEGRAARGSTALAGAVDVLLEMRRYKPDERLDRRRVISGLGRFEEVPDEIVIALAEDGSGYTAEGDRKGLAARELSDAIREALPRSSVGATSEVIHAALPANLRPRRSDVTKMLQHGAANGLWERDGSGKKNDPLRFWKDEK